MFFLAIMVGCGSLTTSNNNSQSEFSSMEENEIVNKPYDAKVYSLDFSSYDELVEHMLNRIDLIQSEMRNDYIVNKLYDDYVAEMHLRKTIKVPTINDEYLELRNLEENCNISLQASDLYDSPWIYYYFSDGDMNSYIKIMNLNNEFAEKTKENGVLKLMEQLDPLPDDDKFYPPYVEVCEKEITLNNVSFKAVVGKYNNDDRIYTNFVYEDAFVIICCSEEKFESGFLSDLSFTELNLRE